MLLQAGDSLFADASDQHWGWALLLGLSACSFGTLEADPCQTNADCRASFGINAVCGEEGLCRVEPSAPRCDRTFPADLYQRPDRYADAIVMGNLMDRSEQRKVARERAAQLAAMEVNEVGGLDGRTLALVMCTIERDFAGDGLGLTDAATTTSRYLTDVVGVSAIIGPSSSDNTLQVFEELTGSDTLLISPAATSPALSGAEPGEPTDAAPGLLWRTVPSDSVQGPRIAEDMVGRGISKVAAIIQRGAYGDDLFAVFSEALENRVEVELFSYELAVERNDAISRVSLTDADEVLFISSQSSDVSAFLATAATDSGYQSKSLFLTDAAASADVVGGADPSLFDRLRGTRPRPLDDSELVYKNFINGYLAAYGEDVTQFSFTAHAYDAAWLVFYGAAWSVLNDGGAVTGPGIARGLRRVSDGAPFEVKGTTWVDIVAELAMGSGVDVRGSSGDPDFDPATEETTGDIEVWVVTDDGGAVEIVPAS